MLLVDVKLAPLPPPAREVEPFSSVEDGMGFYWLEFNERTISTATLTIWCYQKEEVDLKIDL